MAHILVSLSAGTLFGAGLAISQMIDPSRVIGFLDIAGRWDPTLAFVMIGALSITVPAFALARKRSVSPALGGTFRLPTARDIDGPLLTGAAIFGVGWGLSGFCPGPAIAALGVGPWPVAAFGVSMVTGMVAYKFLEKKND